jgi:hypothetical protein
VTAEEASGVSIRPRNPYKNFIFIIFHQKGSFQHKTMPEKFAFSGLTETTEADSAVTPAKKVGDFRIEFLCEYEAICAKHI